MAQTSGKVASGKNYFEETKFYKIQYTSWVGQYVPGVCGGFIDYPGQCCRTGQMLQIYYDHGGDCTDGNLIDMVGGVSHQRIWQIKGPFDTYGECML